MAENYQGYVDTVGYTYGPAISFLPRLSNPSASLITPHYAFYYLNVSDEAEIQMYSSKGNRNEAVTGFLNGLSKEASKAVESEASFHRIANLLVQGTDLAHFLYYFRPKGSSRKIVGFLFDYPESLRTRFEVEPAFFMLQLGCRLLRDYTHLSQAKVTARGASEHSETIRAGVAECMQQVGLRLGVFPFVHRQLAQNTPFFSDSFLDMVQSIVYRPEEGNYASNATLGASTAVSRLILELGQAVPLSETKAIRKLLDVKKNGSASLALVVGTSDIYKASAVGYCPESELERTIPRIVFQGRGAWTIQQDDEPLLRIKDFKPIFTQTVAREFEDTQNWPKSWSTAFLQSVEKLCCKLRDKCKGAVVIVLSNASAEAERLKVRGTPISPVSLVENEGLLSSLASLDGAVLLDENLQCVAFGVILDGTLSPGVGRSDRGSRYNSSANYIHSLAADVRAAGFIFSADGGMDIVTRVEPGNPKSPRRKRSDKNAGKKSDAK